MEMESAGEERLPLPPTEMETQTHQEGFTKVIKRKRRREPQMDTNESPVPRKRPDFPPLSGEALAVSDSSCSWRGCAGLAEVEKGHLESFLNAWAQITFSPPSLAFLEERHMAFCNANGKQAP